MADGIRLRPVWGAFLCIALLTGWVPTAHGQSGDSSSGLSLIQQEPDYLDIGVGAFNAIARHPGTGTSPQAQI